MGSGRTERSSSRRSPLLTKRACVRLTLLLGLLVGGAIVNVAVAWIGHRLAPLDYSLRDLTPNAEIEGIELWREFASPEWIHGDLTTVWTGGTLGGDIRCAVPLWYGSGDEEGEDCMLYTFSSGVPFRSLGTSMMTKLARTETVSNCGCFIPKSVPLIGREWVPICPLWPGFAINTVFYATILWLLFAAPFALRRRLRVKRGLCVKCAYDLRGRAPMSDVCPECGWRPTGRTGAAGGTPTP